MQIRVFQVFTTLVSFSNESLKCQVLKNEEKKRKKTYFSFTLVCGVATFDVQMPRQTYMMLSHYILCKQANSFYTEYYCVYCVFIYVLCIGKKE